LSAFSSLTSFAVRGFATPVGGLDNFERFESLRFSTAADAAGDVEVPMSFVGDVPVIFVVNEIDRLNAAGDDSSSKRLIKRMPRTKRIF
jgi:hypothetical protein